jgi:DNA-binding transcriptional ArsR family regulator
MRTWLDTERQAIGALVETLQRLPGARASVLERWLEHDAAPIDALLDVRIGTTKFRLAVEVKGRVFPRDAEAVAWRIRRFLSRECGEGDPLVGLLAAQVVSEGARKLLQEEGIGWFETGGSLFLSADPVFLIIDRPPAKAVARAMGSIFRGSRAEVLHALWGKRDSWFGATELAAAAGVSPGTASETLMELERRGWVETRGSGPAKERQLSKPSELLDAWADAAQRAPPPRRSRRVFLGGRGDAPSRFAEACSAVGVKHAFTGLFAAQRYAPYLTAVPQAVCWAAPGFEEALGRLEARAADEGWNIAVQEAAGDGVFRHARSVDGFSLASPLHVFLDLQRGSGRSKEMAEHLRREKLRA